MDSTKDLQKLKQDIEKLTKETWIDIYFILQKNRETYTLNKNGLFVDMTSLKGDTITEIKKLVYSN